MLPRGAKVVKDKIAASSSKRPGMSSSRSGSKSSQPAEPSADAAAAAASSSSEPKTSASFVLPAATSPANSPPVAPLNKPAHPPDRRGLERQYSVRSTEVVDTLEQIELEVVAMETQLGQAEATLSAFKPGESELDPQLRNDLAQLHGNANKLLATRIDAILTGKPRCLCRYLV